MVSPSHLGPILAVYCFHTTTSSLPAPHTPPSAPLSSGLLRIHLFREVVAHARHRSTSNSPPNPSSSLQEPANPRLTHRINTSVPPSDPPTSSRPDSLLVFFLASADPGRSSNFKLVRGRGRRGRGPRAPVSMRLHTDRRSTGTSTPLSGPIDSALICDCALSRVRRNRNPELLTDPTHEAWSDFSMPRHKGS